jgi:hypothetical protein
MPTTNPRLGPAIAETRVGYATTICCSLRRLVAHSHALGDTGPTRHQARPLAPI